MSQAAAEAKSTVAALLSRFYDPQQGDIAIDHIDLKNWDPDALRESVGMVALYLVYLVIVIFSSKVRETYRVKVLGRAARNKGSFVTQNLQETLNPMAQSDAVALPTLQQPPSTLNYEDRE